MVILARVSLPVTLAHSGGACVDRTLYVRRWTGGTRPATMRTMNRGRYLPLWVAMAGLGCTDLDHFSTSAGESYCGKITAGEAFRAGFGPRAQVRLKLDAAALDGPGPAGSLSTFEPDEPDTAAQRLLAEAELRRIGGMESDVISRLDLGEGRLKNRVFAVTPTDPDAEAALAILSLRSDDTVEVRLVRAGREPASGAPVPDGRRPLFGVFSLTRQVGACGF
jgi:hypothetical protein